MTRPGYSGAAATSKICSYANGKLAEGIPNRCSATAPKPGPGRLHHPFHHPGNVTMVSAIWKEWFSC